MNITSETIYSVRDVSGNVLFTFPDNSSLVNVIPDLWPSIIKYFDNHLFVIGKFCAQYDDYRLVTKEDLDNDGLKNLFAHLYKLNNGILSLINILDNNNLGVCIFCKDYGDKSCILSFGGKYGYVPLVKESSNKIITLIASGMDIDVFHDRIKII